VDLLDARLHPVSAHALERLLEPREVLQDAARERLARQADLPVERDRLVEPRLVVELVLLRRAHARAHREAVARAAAGPPLGQDRAEARLLERGRGLGQELVCAARVERITRRLARAQAHLDLRTNTGRLRPREQERLGHLTAPALQRRRLAPAQDPRVGGRHEQRRIVGALQQISHVPAALARPQRLARARLTVAAAEIIALLLARLLARRRGLLEPEAEPERRADRDVERLAPVPDLLFEILELVLLAAQHRLLRAPRREPAVVHVGVGRILARDQARGDGDDPVLGLGLAVRAHDVVDQLLDEAHHHLHGRLLRSGRAVDHERASGGGHRAREVVEVAEVLGDPHRLPARGEPAFGVEPRAGRVAWACAPRPREPHRAYPEPQIGPAHDAVQHARALAVAREQVERLARAERDPLHDPRRRLDRIARFGSLTDQRARGQRAVAAGGQPCGGFGFAARGGPERDRQLAG